MSKETSNLQLQKEIWICIIATYARTFCVNGSIIPERFKQNRKKGCANIPERFLRYILLDVICTCKGIPLCFTEPGIKNIKSPILMFLHIVLHVCNAATR